MIDLHPKQIIFSNKHLPQSKLEVALNLVLDYIRSEKKVFLKARNIAAYYGLKDNHSMLTAIGWSLSFLENKGLLKKYNKKTWVATRELAVFLEKTIMRYYELRDFPLDKLTEDQFRYVTNQLLKAKPVQG